ncbi:glycosyltransferase [Exiguobacterium sp. SH1S21]|uniref:glycosyltransferase family 4 protein n=1 Tax=Exiguobacterium sp. SH1S21 TaxID=2510953 RepID=UPI00103E85F1|nr:glycosyltransferase family 4 protein [Exiguobacterium sp. SH1S21]TCI57410.1 glycosyltransferase [Exiguobacterium sp. SH1S21]
MKQRLVFITNIAAPYQVKFCYALQDHFDTEFWFYDQLTARRPDWWKVPLGDRCRVLSGSRFIGPLNYVSFDVFKQLNRFEPDIILLGGFTPLHSLILKIAKRKGSKVVVLSEPIRDVSNEDNASDKLLERVNAKWKTRILHHMFAGADLIFGMGQVARDQFVREFGFTDKQVVNAPYPIDIEAYFDHPLRVKRRGDPIRILFANRLIDRYQPLIALEAYRALKRDYPNLSLALNRDGHLYEACRDYIKEHDLEGVTFLDDIDAWDNMHLVYRESDILVLPATYSNGNITIIEACASGMGTIVSRHVDNVSRHLKEGENCFKCEPTAESLEASLRNYLEVPELLEIHGALSKQNVEHRRNSSTALTYRDLIAQANLI